MKYLTLLFSLSLFYFFGSSCTFSEKNQNQLMERPVHGIPNEGFFDQLIGPNGMDIETYQKGMKQARINAAKAKQFRDTDGEWTVQGPGNLGGRVNQITIDPTNENIIYVGFGLGGIFKTTDGGTTWNPIFDQNEFLTISSIVLDPSDHNTIYVGTGDVAIGAYTHIGNGVFKSTDAGATWTHLGLAEAGIVSKIIVSPSDPNTIYVSAMGFPMRTDNNRGLYKTTDGGANWEQVLFVGDQAGIIDMVMDPNDVNTLFAAGWDRYRTNQQSITTGSAAKIHKTSDGGATWTIIQDSLPQYDLCRIGLAVYPSNPAKIYAIYIGNDYAIHDIYRSDDAGSHWNSLNIEGLEFATSSFGWYFGNIWVNPSNPDDLFVSGVELWRSENNGQNWEMATPPWYEYEVHADMHAMAFAPSGKIYLGTDGGMYRADDDNLSEWTDAENIPTNQIYRTTYDAQNPDSYWGGLQDNGTTVGNKNDINNWERYWGGDGFGMQINPLNGNSLFVSSQNGNIVRINDSGYEYLRSQFNDDRTNWDTPFLLSAHDSTFSFFGTYRVYVGDDSFGSLILDTISEDLTDGPIDPDYYHTISALSESPIVPGLLFAGTTDGNVWYGKFDIFNSPTWTRIDQFNNDYNISDVVGSPTDSNTIYVSETAYMADDFTAKLWRSTDLGTTWTSIAGDLPPVSINEIFVLPGVDDNIIFVANDAGVYVTKNAGVHWERVGTNMPFIPVFDLAHNVANNELVAATFGRSIQTYSLSNIVATKEPKASRKFNNNVQLSPNPASEMVMVSFRKIEPNKTATLVILDLSGKVIHKEKLSTLLRTVDVSAWAKGIYPVMVKERHRVLRGQLVVL